MFRLIIFEFIKSEPIFIRVLRERLAIANTSSVKLHTEAAVIFLKQIVQ